MKKTGWSGTKTIVMATVAIAAILLPVGAAMAASGLGGTSCGDVGFGNYENVVMGAGQLIAEHLVGYGQLMLRAFLLVTLSWYGVGLMFSVGTKQAEPQDLLMKFFALGMIFSIFTYYGQLFAWVNEAVQTLGAAASATTGNAGNSSSQALCVLYGTSTQMWNTIETLPISSHSTLSAVFNPGASLYALGAWAGDVLVLLIVQVEFLIAAGLYLMWQEIFVVFIALAFGLGPIFLPMMMFKFTRDLAFEGWVGFTWTAMLYQLVGPAVLGLVAVVVTQGVGKLNAPTSLFQRSAAGYLTFNAGAVFGLVALGLVIIYILWKLPDLVKQLAAGAAHAGSLPSGFNIASKFSGGS